jgi:hypothetical protein
VITRSASPPNSAPIHSDSDKDFDLDAWWSDLFFIKRNYAAPFGTWRYKRYRAKLEKHLSKLPAWGRELVARVLRTALQKSAAVPDDLLPLFLDIIDEWGTAEHLN